MSEIIRYLSFSDWFVSLSMMLSRYIRAVAKGKVAGCSSGLGVGVEGSSKKEKVSWAQTIGW